MQYRNKILAQSSFIFNKIINPELIKLKYIPIFVNTEYNFYYVFLYNYISNQSIYRLLFLLVSEAFQKKRGFPVSTPINEIIQQLNISKTTLYKYLRTRDVVIFSEKH